MQAAVARVLDHLEEYRGELEVGRSGTGVGPLTPRKMLLPTTQVESEGQANHVGLPSAPIC
jgi:hypothetical protein